MFQKAAYCIKVYFVSVFQHFRLTNRLYCVILKLTTCQRKGYGFVPKDSIELTRARKEEIICAFEQLFQEKSVRSISMWEIGAKTNFARSSIYNYFQTKEEIQLGLTIREFTAWKDALQKISEDENKNILQFAEAIAASLVNRNQFIKLISWNHYEIEENSRPERLAEMQQVTYEAMHLFTICVEKTLPHLSKEETQGFMLDFFTYLYGIDCFIQVSSKQQEALKLGNIPYHPVSIHDAVYGFILRYFKQEELQ